MQTFAERALPAPDDPVLLIHGLCREKKDDAPRAGDCVAAVSRQQFDDLLDALSPSGSVTAGMKERLARAYAEVLAFEDAARQLRVDHSPQYQSRMRWLEAKTLADLLRQRMEAESRTVSESEIAAYYREQLVQFDEVMLQRLALPKNNFAASDRQGFEADAQRIAGQLRERAAHGEDLQRLQKEAYQALGFAGSAPSTEVGSRRRASLLPAVRDEVFSLQPGEISKVEDEIYSFVIYKVETKRTLPLEQVREEIHREIAKVKLERAFQSIAGSIRMELSENYFATPPAQ
jgi:parvulin-like peptidyl-prolyl isomerase